MDETQKRLDELAKNYEKTGNPLFHFEALLLCLSENVVIPESLSDWLAEGVFNFLAKNCLSKKSAEYRSLDECFGVSYGKFENLRFFEADRERQRWALYVQYLTGAPNSRALELLEAEGIDVKGFQGRFERGLSKSRVLERARKKYPPPEDEVNDFMKRLSPEAIEVLKRRRRKKG